MATSNINEIEQLQQNETLKNLLLRIDDDEIEQLQQDDTLKNLLRRIIDDDAIDQHQQNDSLTNLLLRKDEIDDKNLTKDDNNGEEMYPIITHLQEPIFQNKITLSIGEVFTLDFYSNAAVFRSELPEVKQFSKNRII
jgi:hypothetical protein